MNPGKVEWDEENEPQPDMTRLEQWISRQEDQMRKDIAALIKIPSVADLQEAVPGAPYGKKCREALEQMRTFGQREQMETEDIDGHCLTITAGKGTVEIGIWNHLDVVPEGRGWTYPPYMCTEKDGYLIGRGVQDNKGPAVAVLYAMKYCREKGILKNIKVRQILGCQEESGMTDVEYYLKRKKAPEYSFVADCGFPVCCGEKGHCNVLMETVSTADGILEFSGGTAPNSVPSFAHAATEDKTGQKREEEAVGISGHAAFPDGTQNAIGMLCGKLKTRNLPERTKEALGFVERLSDGGYGEKAGIGCSDEYSGRLTCNPGQAFLHDGHLRIVTDIRYPVTKTTEDFLPELKKEAAGSGVEIIGVEDSRPYYMNPAHPFIQVLMEAWKEVTGLEGRPFVMGGGTYARKIPNAVAFGPGQERSLNKLGLPDGHGNCHCADEAELFENLKNAVKIYVSALEKLDKRVKEIQKLSKIQEDIKNENVSDQ